MEAFITMKEDISEANTNSLGSGAVADVSTLNLFRDFGSNPELLRFGPDRGATNCDKQLCGVDVYESGGAIAVQKLIYL